MYTYVKIIQSCFYHLTWIKLTSNIGELLLHPYTKSSYNAQEIFFKDVSAAKSEFKSVPPQHILNLSFFPCLASPGKAQQIQNHIGEELI